MKFHAHQRFGTGALTTLLALSGFAFGAAPAAAMEWPLTKAVVQTAGDDGQKITARQVAISTEWEVPSSTVDARALHVYTPYRIMLFAAARAHDRYEDVPAAVAEAISESGRIVSFSVRVLSVSLGENESPVFVIKQGGKVIHATKSTGGSADVDDQGRGFWRTVSGDFQVSQIDISAPLEVIVADIDDRGRADLHYSVDLTKMR